MFEQYGLYHYSFSEDDKRPIERIVQMEFGEEDLQSIDAILRADYHLSGYVDVLPAVPQPENTWRSHMFLQSFSLMRSGPGYYTVRDGAESYLLICTLSGRGILEYEGHVYTLDRGSAVWLDCRKHHDYRTVSGSWEHIDVHTEGTGIRRLYEEYTKRESLLTVYPDTGALTVLLEHVLQAYTVPSLLRSMRIAHALESLFVMLNEARYPQMEEQHNCGNDCNDNAACNKVTGDVAVNLDFQPKGIHQLRRLRIQIAEALTALDYLKRRVGNLIGGCFRIHIVLSCRQRRRTYTQRTNR